MWDTRYNLAKIEEYHNKSSSSIYGHDLERDILQGAVLLNNTRIQGMCAKYHTTIWHSAKKKIHIVHSMQTEYKMTY